MAKATDKVTEKPAEKPAGVAVKLDGAAVLALLERFVAAAESIAKDTATVRAYIETNGVPGSLYERLQRALPRARTVRGVLGLWLKVRDGLGPGERGAALELCVIQVAGLVSSSRQGDARQKWARWVLTAQNTEAAAVEEDKRVADERRASSSSASSSSSTEGGS